MRFKDTFCSRLLCRLEQDDQLLCRISSSVEFVKIPSPHALQGAALKRHNRTPYIAASWGPAQSGGFHSRSIFDISGFILKKKKITQFYYTFCCTIYSSLFLIKTNVIFTPN